MPAEERRARTAERCALHPGSPAVAACGSCGRPLCLSCAVPVRGRVLGPECLAEVLGEDAPEPEPEVAGARSLRHAAAGAAFAIAVASTALPWSRFGEGSGPFGAWGRSPRWSLLASVSALLGLILWAVRRRRDLRGWGWDAALAALGWLVAIGATLALLHPPSFARAGLAPWIALAAGAVAIVASFPLAARRWRGDA